MAGHEGHRDRMKKRFLRFGLDAFDDHNVLELLLFYAQPRQDTNETAHLLMESFGSLERVFSASPEELMAVKGVKENAACLIRLVKEIGRRCAMEESVPGVVLSDASSAGRFFLPRFMNCRNETVQAAFLNAGLKVLDCRQVGEGGLTSTGFSTRRIAQLAMSLDAQYVILAHNHTSDIALPSPEDRAATRYLRDALKMVDVELLDHIVVAGDDFVSLRDDGFFDM